MMPILLVLFCFNGSRFFFTDLNFFKEDTAEETLFLFLDWFRCSLTLRLFY